MQPQGRFGAENSTITAVYLGPLSLRIAYLGITLHIHQNTLENCELYISHYLIRLIAITPTLTD